MSHSKSTVYVSYIVPSSEPRFFSGEWGERGGGRLIQILSLRRGANSCIYGVSQTLNF